MRPKSSTKWEQANPDKVKASRARWVAANPAKVKETRERYYHRHVEARRAAGRDGHRKRKYGITPAMMQEMLAAQGHACAICRRGFDARRRPHVDHSHATGAVRGLLCVKCNSMLGHAEDSAATLAQGIAYLRRSEP